jgi:hypothetical protein
VSEVQRKIFLDEDGSARLDGPRMSAHLALSLSISTICTLTLAIDVKELRANCLGWCVICNAIADGAQ